jgi:hypothetical protein
MAKPTLRCLFPKALRLEGTDCISPASTGGAFYATSDLPLAGIHDLACQAAHYQALRSHERPQAEVEKIRL